MNAGKENNDAANMSAAKAAPKAGLGKRPAEASAGSAMALVAVAMSPDEAARVFANPPPKQDGTTPYIHFKRRLQQVEKGITASECRAKWLEAGRSRAYRPVDAEEDLSLHLKQQVEMQVIAEHRELSAWTDAFARASVVHVQALATSDGASVQDVEAALWVAESHHAQLDLAGKESGEDARIAGDLAAAAIDELCKVLDAKKGAARAHALARGFRVTSDLLHNIVYIHKGVDRPRRSAEWEAKDSEALALALKDWIRAAVQRKMVYTRECELREHVTVRLLIGGVSAAIFERAFHLAPGTESVTISGTSLAGVKPLQGYDWFLRCGDVFVSVVGECAVEVNTYYWLSRGFDGSS